MGPTYQPHLSSPLHALSHISPAVACGAERPKSSPAAAPAAGVERPADGARPWRLPLVRCVSCSLVRGKAAAEHPRGGSSSLREERPAELTRRGQSSLRWLPLTHRGQSGGGACPRRLRLTRRSPSTPAAALAHPRGQSRRRSSSTAALARSSRAERWRSMPAATERPSASVSKRRRVETEVRREKKR